MRHGNPLLVPKLIEAPQGDVVSLNEAKAHLRVDHDDEDDLIQRIVTAATFRCEDLTRRLLAQKWRAFFADFGAADARLTLPHLPVAAIDSVKYFDASNAEQTVDPSNYVLLEDYVSAYVALAVDGAWPSPLACRADAVSITFTAGYGDADDVPTPIRQAILLMVGDLYEHRETVVIGTSVSEIPMSAAVDDLLMQYRAFWF